METRASSSSQAGKRRVPGTPLGGERGPQSPVTPLVLKHGKAPRYDVGTPVPHMPGSAPELTYDGMAALLDKKLSPITEQMHGIESKFDDLKISVAKEIIEVKDKVQEFGVRLDQNDIRFEKLEELFKNTPDGGTVSEALKTELKQLRQDIDDLKKDGHNICSQAIHNGFKE